jgi:pimeloyl-ACP methyl ester carboxylesterase
VREVESAHSFTFDLGAALRQYPVKGSLAVVCFVARWGITGVVEGALLTEQGRGRADPPSLTVLAERFEPEVMDVPEGSARIRLAVQGVGAWDALVSATGARLAPADGARPDAVLKADEDAWARIARDVRGGMDAFHAGRLRVRENLHLGVGFLAATSGTTDPGRLRFESVKTRWGNASVLLAGAGSPVVCVHGLGGTKSSFLPTVAALAEHHRVIALDLPGFGESEKPVLADYDAAYFAEAVAELLDALKIERADLIGNSMGGRISIELGLRAPERVGRIVLLSPALAWLRRDRRFELLLRLPLPRLGLIQPTPRWVTEQIVRRLVPGGDDGWAAAGVDEFLRAYLTARGRAAFYAAARNIYLDEPHGDNGFWTRLRELSPEAMFVWGRRDSLVPIGFRKHVQRAVPAAEHVELDCGHVPQVEAPHETHTAIGAFLAQGGREARGAWRRLAAGRGR